jgi:hypothetical protein
MVSLKMMKAEIFELFDEVTGLMITCKNDSIRKLSKEIVLTFIQNYPLSEALLEKIVLRLLNNMEFGEHEGRRAVLNVLERLIDKLPIEVFTKQAEVMVIAFTARLVNEDVLEIKEYATQIFKSLMEKIRDADGELAGLIPKMFEYCAVWLRNETEVTRRSGLQLLKILFWVTGSFNRVESTIDEIVAQLDQTCEDIAVFWANLKTNFDLKDTLKANAWKDVFWDEGEFDTQDNLSRVKATKTIVLDYLSFIQEILLHDKTKEALRSQLLKLVLKVSRHPDEEVQLVVLHLTARLVQSKTFKSIIREHLKGYLVFLFASVRSKHLHEQIIPVLETQFRAILGSYADEIPMLRTMILTAVNNINFKFLRYGRKHFAVVNKCIAVSRVVLETLKPSLKEDDLKLMLTFFIRMTENGFVKEDKEGLERLEHV